ncbi:RagB/SusD family nutrient uptake outer membrane protein [Fulvivirgaceae bacterium BMA12]|uniref:RagB/SusD family nutrient uptake outer membrane protein n=1 Tax=Agaribacillus aureus TaxID=3051825 RepID=A0ABT8LGZ4_9BACT|nr:RagB/SusD family nutrient uptake outer membrane protein [Fulvivirgaceae bacterium BMA12]
MRNLIKYLKRLIPGILLCMVIVSCSDFLEEDPQNTVAQNNYYANEQDAISAVNAIYAYLGSYNLDFAGPFPGNTAGIYHSTFWVTSGLASDNLKNNQLGAVQNDQLATFSYNAENANLLEIWRVHYKAIYLANIAIERIPGIEMDNTLKNRLVNEAKFLRGLMYFNMVRMFGDIPLIITESSPLNVNASPADEIYDQIILDFTDAEALPPDGSIAEGRATGGAAKALLAKVYLTLEDYQKASEKALEVIDANTYELWDNFADVFKLSSRGGKEAIFSVGFGDAGGSISFWEVGQFNVRLLPVELSNARSQVSNTQGWQTATQDLYDAFDVNDERRNVIFMTEFLDDDGVTVQLDKIYIKKYWDEAADPTAGGSSNDFPVIRYAEVLLIYAEAQAELGNFNTANDYLNLVRNRAGLGDVNLTGLAEFKEAVLDERRKEFVAEGIRWFDLVRTETLDEKVHAAKDDEYAVSIPTLGPDYYVFPIPQRERDTNPNLPQNAGF